NALKISCLEEKGINAVIEAIQEQIKKTMPDKNKDLFFSSWQKDLTVDTLEQISELETYIISGEIEIINVLIKKIFENLKDLTGTISSHSVYDRIFSGFCLGK
ncbi:MAG TPA: hypothetical protein PKM18_02150, partial [bacterium]|nr:hypothetical protein [bacterium]